LTVTGNCGRGAAAAVALPAAVVRVAVPLVVVVPLRVAVPAADAVAGRAVACVVGALVAPEAVVAAGTAVGEAIPPHAARRNTATKLREISLKRGRSTAHSLSTSKVESEDPHRKNTGI